MSVIRIDEQHGYDEEDLKKRLEEIYKASLKFVEAKELDRQQAMDVLSMMLTELVTDDFRARFNLEMWEQKLESGSRLHDLILLARMWYTARQYMVVENSAVSFKTGKEVMQDIANQTAKLKHHWY